MRIFKLFPALFMSILWTKAGDTGSVLFGEGPTLEAAHRYLFGEFLAGRESEFSGEGTDRTLRTAVIWRGKPAEFDGEIRLTMDSGTERVMHEFRYFEVQGEGLTGITRISLDSFQPGVGLNRSTTESKVYRVKMPSLPAPTESNPPAVLHLTGKGRIDRVLLVSFGSGIREEFDDLPFRNLGHDTPPEKVTVSIDPGKEDSIEGHIGIDRSKWFRYYGAPGASPSVLEDWARERNFEPGRQMFKFEPALVKGYSKNQPTLGEDPKRPGYADPEFFAKYNNGIYRNAPKDWPDLKFAMCFNDWPEFMSIPHVGRGTPLEKLFPAAGDLAVQFLKSQIRDSGRTADWWELKNEATIKAEWDYHWKPGVDSWKLMADFHNTVADAAHAEVPGVKIGGPASAWMQVQVQDFKLWKDHVRFMDQTREHLDFYSHHFYEDTGTIGAHARLKKGYSNYLLGRLEAVMDMYLAHMSGTGSLLPILITEYGSLNVGRSEADYWLQLRTYNAYLVHWMQRPHQVDLAVPFIFLSSPWDPKSGLSVFVPKDEPKEDRPAMDRYELTPNRYFFEMWRDFAGRRLVAETGADWLTVVAAYDDDGSTIRIALSNMAGQRRSVDLSSLAEKLTIKTASQRRLYRLDGKIEYLDGSPLDLSLSEIPLEVEETCVVTLTLAEAIGPEIVSERKTWFAGETSASPGTEFGIHVPDLPENGTAVLVAGIHRTGGWNGMIRGKINGKDFSREVEWARGISEMFAPVRIPISFESVGGENTVTFQGMEEGSTISSLGIELRSSIIAIQ